MSIRCRKESEMLRFRMFVDRLVCRWKGHDTYVMDWREYHPRTGNWIAVYTCECARCFYQRRAGK
jgi:hypothetical protein